MSDAAPDPLAAARVVDALRRGWPVRISGANGALRLLAVEGTDDAALADFAGGGVQLLISGERAATLKLTNQRAAATPGPVLIAPFSGGVAHAVAVADPALDLAHPMKGPFAAAPCPVPDVAVAAITLARHAGRLPAWFVAGDGAVEAHCTTADVAALLDTARLAIAARARLPIAASVEAEIIGFRSPAEPSDHVALIVGTRDASLPVVRLHSECLTGDVFGSLKCDCGPQLHAALDAMAGARWGVLLYLRQEGRGIGLVNKLRAYALQDQGFDTVDANTRLGFPVEARDFGIAAAMLRLLGIRRIALMTNNPAKVERLAAEGIDVAERLPLILPANPHNAAYLATKRDRTGHQL